MRCPVSLFVLLAAAACGAEPSPGFEDAGAPRPAQGAPGAGAGSTSGAAPPVEPSLGVLDASTQTQACTKMDIVFVVDDSGSMSEEQENLVNNFPKFVAVLDAFKSKAGASIDYRVAVTTTGRTMTYYTELPPIPGLGQLPPTTTSQKGDDGAFRSGCPGMSRPWIERADADRVSTFACVAKVGTKGPGVEMPLETMRRSLRERMADKKNGAFLREDALLALVILTDEEDCSRSDDNFTVGIGAEMCAKAETPESYAAFLDSLKGRGRWATAVVAGPGPGSCNSSFGGAAEAKRLQSFVRAAGANGKFSSICAGDLATSMNDALGTFNAACENLVPR